MYLEKKKLMTKLGFIIDVDMVGKWDTCHPGLIFFGVILVGFTYPFDIQRLALIVLCERDFTTSSQDS